MGRDWRISWQRAFWGRYCRVLSIATSMSFWGLQALVAKILVPPNRDVRDIATRQQVLEAAIRQI